MLSDKRCSLGRDVRIRVSPKVVDVIRKLSSLGRKDQRAGVKERSVNACLLLNKAGLSATRIA
jgi:hypothetical protein